MNDQEKVIKWKQSRKLVDNHCYPYNSYVRTATRTTLKVEANLTQILNFTANFHTEFEPFFKKKKYANNGGHFKNTISNTRATFAYYSFCDNLRLKCTSQSVVIVCCHFYTI